MIFIATKNRRSNFERYIEACKDTGVTEPHVVILEKGDTSYNGIELPFGWIVRVYEGGKGACTHYNKVFAEFPNEEYYGFMADDVVPETYQWDRTLIDACLPDKVAYGDDGIDHTDHCGQRYFPTHCFIGGELVRKWGFVVPTNSDHHGADQWWFDAGEQVVLPDVKLTHHHFTNGKAVKDKTYQERPRAYEEKLKYIKFKEKHKHLLVPKLHIICVKWGTKYNAQYVNNLSAMVSRNLSMAHRFICYTDDPTGLDKGIEVKGLPGNVTGWWNKLYIFLNEKHRCLYLDLDTVITGNLDEMAGYNGSFAALRDFTRPDGLGSGVMMWNGDHSDIWFKWLQAGKPTKISGSDTIGDQAWIERMRPKADRLQDLYQQAIYSYKMHCRGWPPNGAKIVCFHGEPRPHEVTRGWIGMFWNKTRTAIAEPVFDKDLQQVNAEDRVFVENTMHNISLGLKEIKNSRPRESAAVIVGGAPSLEQTYKYISGLGDVFALNNTAKWLMDRNIIPNYQVIMDARPDNAEFVNKPHKRITYLMASCVHPKVIENLKNYDVWLWHPDTCGLTDHLLGDAMLIGGGNTVLLHTIALAKAIGYKEFHIFGADSSLQDDKHHAYEQKINDGKERVETIVHGRKFISEWWMIKQVKLMQQMIRVLLDDDCDITFYGDGLMQWTVERGNERQ